MFEDFYNKFMVGELTKPDTEVPHWIVCQGFPKAWWAVIIENCNKLMDDNKMLSLS